MAIWCMFFMRVLMLGFGIFSLVGLCMECLQCITPCTPHVMVMSGLVFHPLFCMVLN